MNGQTFSLVYTLLIVGLMAFMVIRSINIIKLGKKNKAIVEAIQRVDDEADFNEYINTIRETASDEIKIKLDIVSIWGRAIHKHTEDFEEKVNSLDLKSIIKETKNGLSIEGNEDSFFYLALAIPNILYGNECTEERKIIENKLLEVDEDIKDQLIIEIGKNCQKYYNKEGDKGQRFFERILEGDYAEYIYSKQLIGLYKEICNAMLYKIYDENNDSRKEELLDNLKLFASRGVGTRWLKALGLEVPKDKEEKEGE